MLWGLIMTSWLVAYTQAIQCRHNAVNSAKISCKCENYNHGNSLHSHFLSENNCGNCYLIMVYEWEWDKMVIEENRCGNVENFYICRSVGNHDSIWGTACWVADNGWLVSVDNQLSMSNLWLIEQSVAHWAIQTLITLIKVLCLDMSRLMSWRMTAKM